MKVAIMFTLAVIAFAQDNYVFGPSIMINDDEPGSHFRATTQRSIACRGDTVYVVWRDDRYGNPCIFFSKSTDAGGEWSPNLLISQNLDTLSCFLPHLSIDALGNLFVAYCTQNENTADRDVYFTRSNDEGATFSFPIIVNDSVIVKWQTDCACSMDSAGQHVYVVWEDTRNPPYDTDIYLARSTDGGGNFLSTVRVNDDSSYTRQWYPVIACDNSGQYVYVVWQDFRDTLYGANVYFARSTDYGQTFTQNYCIHDTATTGISKQGDPSIYFVNGIIHLAWRDERDDYTIYFDKSTDGGASFGIDTEIWDGTSGAGMYPSITADDSGRIYAVWYDSRTFGSTGFDIYFSYSDDGGASFHPNVRVNDLLGIASAWDMRPAVAVNHAGTVFVTWDSDRDSPSGACNDIYFASGQLTGIYETSEHSLRVSGMEIVPTIFKNSVSIRLPTLDNKRCDIRLYDVTGRLIKSFVVHQGPANAIVYWDGKDESGLAVVQGSYFIVIFVDGRIVHADKVIKAE